MTDGFLPWLRSSPASPRFAFLNLGDIDRSGHIDQSGASVPAGGVSAVRQAALTETDTQVGLFVDELKSSGEWDNSVLIFTSDHGMDWSTADHDTSLSLVPGDATTVQVKGMPGVQRMIAGRRAMHQTRYPFVAITAAHINSEAPTPESDCSRVWTLDSWASADEENVDR